MVALSYLQRTLPQEGYNQLAQYRGYREHLQFGFHSAKRGEISCSAQSMLSIGDLFDTARRSGNGFVLGGPINYCGRSVSQRCNKLKLRWRAYNWPCCATVFQSAGIVPISKVSFKRLPSGSAWYEQGSTAVASVFRQSRLTKEQRDTQDELLPSEPWW